MPTDTERINWLNKQQGYALVSDDNKHWALVVEGEQNIPATSPGNLLTTFFIETKDWSKTVRQAIDREMKRR